MLQQILFENEVLEILPSYLGDSHANLIALQENVKHLMMSVIFGESTLGSFAKLNQDGSWGKMSQGYYQVRMDGSSEEFLGTWPDWGIALDGVATQLVPLERYSKEVGYSLLPAPIATDYKGSYRNYSKLMNHILSKDHQVRISELLLACGTAKSQIPTEYELAMGYPIGWTGLSV